MTSETLSTGSTTMPSVVIFGATGYLGSHVAEQMTLAGIQPVCVVRESSDSQFLHSVDATICSVDFSDVAALAALIPANSVVVNCVADTRMHLSDVQRREVEIEITSRIFRAAEQAAAKRFIQLSTVMAYGFDRPVEAINETWPSKPEYSYSRIAVEREQVLLKLQKNSSLELLILQPSNTLGRRDSSALPAMLEAHQKGQFAVFGGGEWKVSCMDARDVGRAMVHLLSVPVNHAETYLVKGYDINWLDIKAELDSRLGSESKLVNIPKGIGMLIARVLEFFYPWGSNPMLTRFTVEVLSAHTLFDDSKIRATGFESAYNLKQTLENALVK